MEFVESSGGADNVKWSSLHLPGRLTNQIRSRWENDLDPSLTKGKWTEAEMKILREGQEELGNKWSEIAKRIPGRNEKNVKNRWYNQKVRYVARAGVCAHWLYLYTLISLGRQLSSAHQTSDKKAKKKQEAEEQSRRESLELEQQQAAAAAADQSFQQFEQYAPLPELLQSALMYEEHAYDDDSATLEYGQV